MWVPAALRLSLVFGLLFGGVFFAFRWAGSAVRFSAARAADRSFPTWRVTGTVRDAVTQQPIPWALVEDDPAGQPPLFRADADYRGVFRPKRNDCEPF
jgi:fatty acid desaturase